MRILWQTLNALIGVLFLFAAALQYNDPDPWRWMAVYLAAAVPCFVALRRSVPWILPAVVGVGAMGWAAIYAARGAWSVPFREMFAEWEMKNQQVVETREMFGLLIVGGWMLVLVVVASLAPRRRGTGA